MHVSSIIFDMFWTIKSISSQTCCHGFCGIIVLFCSMLVSCWIFVVLFSENLMQNWLIFSGGMGFSILGALLFGVGMGIFDIIILEGISRHIG